jgi:hypothetical protein
MSGTFLPNLKVIVVHTYYQSCRGIVLSYGLKCQSSNSRVLRDILDEGGKNGPVVPRVHSLLVRSEKGSYDLLIGQPGS